MKDKSIFQGVKELGDLQFEDKGSVWDVGELCGNKYVQELCGKYYVHRMTIRKIKRESNKALYARVKELLESET